MDRPATHGSRRSSAPAIELKTLKGSPLSLAALRGKTILLHFWTPSCFVCPQEMRTLEKLSRELEGEDFVLLSVISLDVSEDAVQAARDMNLGVPVLLDVKNDVAKRYYVSLLPVTFVIGPDGNFLEVTDPDNAKVMKSRFDGPRTWLSSAFLNSFRETVRRPRPSPS